jgi:hypothetical protein
MLLLLSGYTQYYSVSSNHYYSLVATGITDVRAESMPTASVLQEPHGHAAVLQFQVLHSTDGVDQRNLPLPSATDVEPWDDVTMPWGDQGLDPPETIGKQHHSTDDRHRKLGPRIVHQKVDSQYLLLLVECEYKC